MVLFSVKSNDCISLNYLYPLLFSLGPAYWSNSYPLCAGQNQSPVDLDSVVEDNTIGAMTFTNYSSTSGYTMTLKNNGHTGK